MRTVQPTICLLVSLLLTLAAGSATGAARVAVAIPPTWDIVADDFESGALYDWQESSMVGWAFVPGGGHYGSSGLSVALNQNAGYLYRRFVTRHMGVV